MWMYPKYLPGWAYKQQEINGNKNINEKTAVWFFDSIVADEGGCRLFQELNEADFL